MGVSENLVFRANPSSSVIALLIVDSRLAGICHVISLPTNLAADGLILGAAPLAFNRTR